MSRFETKCLSLSWNKWLQQSTGIAGRFSRARQKDRRDFCVNFPLVQALFTSRIHPCHSVASIFFQRPRPEAHSASMKCMTSIVILKSGELSMCDCISEEHHVHLDRMTQVQIVHDVSGHTSTVEPIVETTNINHINFADAVHTVSCKLMLSLRCF